MSVVCRVRASVLGCRLHYCVTAAALLGEMPRRSSLVAGQRLQQIHTSTVHRANLLKKLINKSKKKTWYVTPPQKAPSNPWAAAVRPTRKRDHEDSHRFKVLNSLLFKAVNELLTSGQVSHELTNYSPEISKVSLAPDFSNCRVFWNSSGDFKRDELIQTELDKNGPSIRYLIMSHQVMGGVPPLVFLKDRQRAAMAEVDMLLQQADFGPDPPEDSLNDGHAPPPTISPVSSALFGVDHLALNRQISEWRQRSKGEELEEKRSAELTQEQLYDVLAEHRKQQVIKKRKKKAPAVDDDVTPRDFLQTQRDDVTSRRSCLEDEEGEDTAFTKEKDQLQELMSHEDRKL